jgi:hypothetical protein
MIVDLSVRDLEMIRESLMYSKRAASEGSAPYDQKQLKLAAMDELLEKLPRVAATIRD